MRSPIVHPQLEHKNNVFLSIAEIFPRAIYAFKPLYFFLVYVAIPITLPTLKPQ
jgi:hypothetical protein